MRIHSFIHLKVLFPETVSLWPAAQHSPSSELLSALVEPLNQRVVQGKAELLTLEAGLKLAWGLAYFQQYR